jgi:hypothetical protein
MGKPPDPLVAADLRCGLGWSPFHGRKAIGKVHLTG